MTTQPQSAVPTAEAHRQYGAVCWRLREGQLEVLLITSRDTGRWVIPKGWPIKGKTPAESAAQEAFEEAGVRGTLSPASLGIYGYDKALCRDKGAERHIACAVGVFALRVDSLAEDFPEQRQRRRKWFAAEKAGRKVHEPELCTLLTQFAAQTVDTPAPIDAPDIP